MPCGLVSKGVRAMAMIIPTNWASTGIPAAVKHWDPCSRGTFLDREPGRPHSGNGIQVKKNYSLTDALMIITGSTGTFS